VLDEGQGCAWQCVPRLQKMLDPKLQVVPDCFEMNGDHGRSLANRNRKKMSEVGLGDEERG
jgi:hypothetical protein